MKQMIALALCLCLAGAGLSQTATFNDPANLAGERVKPRDGRELPIDQGTSGLEQMLRRLNTRASILNIVAHPDDEDGGMLTFYSRGQGARVADLSLTRGEGGQNAMTGDFEDALGLLRTQELLSCDRYSGIDQFFGTEVDFGFSKTKEEAFAKWGHQRLLYDVVRAIRVYRPLILTSTWIGGVTDGHGQHQVSGEIAQEAFKAAGDPKVFPELTAEGIYPWQPLKIYARVPQTSISDKGLYDYATGQFHAVQFIDYVTGEVSTTPPSTDIVVHEGQTDLLLAGTDGTAHSYVQFARMGLAQQKSQIGPGGRIPGGGVFDVSYHRYGSMLSKEKQKQQETSFFDGIDTSIEGIADVAPHASGLRQNLSLIAATIQLAIDSFKAKGPSECVSPISMALAELNGVIGVTERMQIPNAEKANVLHELYIKRVQLNDALALALGVKMDATANVEDADVGTEVPVHVTLSQGTYFTLPEVHLTVADSAANATPDNRVFDTEGVVTSHKVFSQSLTAGPSLTSAVTRPYFDRKDIEQPVYQIERPALRLAPQTPPALTAWADISYSNVVLRVGRVVHAGSQTVDIVPPVNLSLSSKAQVLLRYREPGFSVEATLQTHGLTNTTPGSKVHLETPRGWKVESSGPYPAGRTGFLVVPPDTNPYPSGTLTGLATYNETTFSEGYRPVGYGDLPRTNYYTPATDRIVPVDLKLPAQSRIAYLPGTGDAVPEALASISLKPEMLTIADLTPDKLKQFDTVVLGVRTYSAHPDLHGAPTQALLDYARNGGNVVVQYQTLEFTAADAPYPITLAPSVPQGTVVDENAPVKLLDPSSPLLSAPNKITPADFDGWIEERGHGFLRSWDTHYTALTETHDPGSPSEGVLPQDPQRGGLITVQLGSGRWTYLAFAVYRQLPEAVPGAYRLFVNLLQK